MPEFFVGAPQLPHPVDPTQDEAAALAAGVERLDRLLRQLHQRQLKPLVVVRKANHAGQQ